MKKLHKAIISRNKNIFKIHVKLSKLLKLNNMDDYLYVTSMRIIDFAKNNEEISNHIIIDYLSNDIWLDIKAYINLKSILLGYLEPLQYINVLEIMNETKIKNSLLGEIVSYFQSNNLNKLYYIIINGFKRKYKEYNLNMIYLAVLELLSRTKIIRKYFAYKDELMLKKARKTSACLVKYYNYNKERAA